MTDQQFPDLPNLPAAGLAEFLRISTAAEAAGLWSPTVAGMAFGTAQAFGLLAEAMAALLEHGAVGIRDGALRSTGWLELVTRLSTTATWYSQLLITQQGVSLRTLAAQAESAAIIAAAENVAAQAAEGPAS